MRSICEFLKAHGYSKKYDQLMMITTVTIMNQPCNMKIDRLAGAEAISERAREIGIEKELVISECVWDIGEACGLQHAHRLDLSTTTKTVRLYFPDLELTTAGNEARKKRTEDRLYNAIAQLLPRSPAPTYATTALEAE